MHARARAHTHTHSARCARNAAISRYAGHPDHPSSRGYGRCVGNGCVAYKLLLPLPHPHLQARSFTCALTFHCLGSVVGAGGGGGGGGGGAGGGQAGLLRQVTARSSGAQEAYGVEAGALDLRCAYQESPVRETSAGHNRPADKCLPHLRLAQHHLLLRQRRDVLFRQLHAALPEQHKALLQSSCHAVFNSNPPRMRRCRICRCVCCCNSPASHKPLSLLLSLPLSLSPTPCPASHPPFSSPLS